MGRVRAAFAALLARIRPEPQPHIPWSLLGISVGDRLRLVTFDVLDEPCPHPALGHVYAVSEVHDQHFVMVRPVGDPWTWAMWWPTADEYVFTVAGFELLRDGARLVFERVPA